MKTLCATAICFLTLISGVNAQQLSSDDPSLQVQPTKHPQVTVSLPEVLNSSVTGTVFPCGRGTDTLINNGSCGAIWASDSMGTNVLSMTDTLVFGPITADTTLYLVGLQGSQNTSAPLPPHASTFSGNVRGYWFTSPVDMIITGFWVPTDAGSGPQNVECVIFNNQTPPPLWSSTTNDFVSQGYWNNFPANDTIDACIQVMAGDVIGIYGTRNDLNSYGGAPYTSMIDGNMVTFTRSGMQQPLSSNQMANIFQESGGSISRVEFFYDVNPTTGAATAVNVTVPYPTTNASKATICSGDSIFVGGAYQTAAGVYFDTLQTVFGCDSIQETTLFTDQSYFIFESANICLGDSLLLGGAYQTSAGIYTDSLQTMLGCDSTVVTFLDITTRPVVSFSNLNDTICAQADPFGMNASPTGGTYSGTGVSGGLFDPAAANIGANNVLYEYTDTVGCYGSATATFFVQDCASIGEATLEGVNVYPNPMADFVTVVLPDNLLEGECAIYDAKGRVVKSYELTQGPTT